MGQLKFVTKLFCIPNIKCFSKLPFVAGVVFIVVPSVVVGKTCIAFVTIGRASEITYYSFSSFLQSFLKV
jgi:hypothetical protein